MATIRETLKKILILNGLTIAIVVLAICSIIIPAIYISQKVSEDKSLPPIDTTSPKEQYEIAKLAAEIRQIRSDTSGSLFWLKMIALFVTVGGAVGGYLAGQSHVAQRRIDFENRKNIESAYQTIVQELSDKAPLLRAAAAVKLGYILKAFPAEWGGDEPDKKEWKQQQIQLTKQVLAASLSIERDRKVLKTLTIALALHKRWEVDSTGQPLTILGANVPFAFEAGDKSLPPGDYTVRSLRSKSDMLSITGRNGESVKVRQAKPIRVDESKFPKRAKLVFHRYGERYFLSQVWPARKEESRKQEYRQLPKSSEEVTLERQAIRKASKSGLSPADPEVEVLDKRHLADVRELDLSGAKAADAYWASIDFSYSDFYKADLRGASFRKSDLSQAQFREANLRGAVFIDANCAGGSYKLANLSNADLSSADFRETDLRDADLTEATLQKTRFENAKVHKCKLTNAKKVVDNHPDDKVDDSVDGDKTKMITVREWLERETKPKADS